MKILLSNSHTSTKTYVTDFFTIYEMYNLKGKDRTQIMQMERVPSRLRTLFFRETDETVKRRRIDTTGQLLTSLYSK